MDSHCGNCTQIPQKFKNRTTILFNNLTSGNIYKANKITTTITAASFTIAKIWNLSILSAGWMNKDYTLTHITHTWQWNIIQSRERNSAICNSMDELGGHYVKWYEPDKDKYCIISFTLGIWKKKVKHRNRG